MSSWLSMFDGCLEVLPPLSDEQMLEPIRVLDAIVKSVATGETVRLRP